MSGKAENWIQISQIPAQDLQHKKTHALQKWVPLVYFWYFQVLMGLEVFQQKKEVEKSVKNETNTSVTKLFFVTSNLV